MLQLISCILEDNTRQHIKCCTLLLSRDFLQDCVDTSVIQSNLWKSTQQFSDCRWEPVWSSLWTQSPGLEDCVLWAPLDLSWKNPILFECSSQYILCWQLSSFTCLERNTKCHAQNPQVYSVSGQFHYISLDNFHLSFYSMIFHTLLSLLGHSQPLSASISAVMLLFRENRNKKIRGSFYMLPSSTCTLASVPSSRTQLQLVTPSTAECEYLPKYRLIPIRQSYYNILH